MNIQPINIGQYPNDGTGDDLRTAFEKIVGNFSEIDLNVVLSAENIGDGAPIAIANPIANSLRFRTIVSGNDNMSVSYDTNEITLAVSDFALQDLTNVASTAPNVNESLVWNGTEWTPLITVTKIVAGDNITISPESGMGEITINSLSNVPSDFNFGTLGNVTNIFELILQSTSVDFGTISEKSSILLDLGGIGSTPLPPPPPVATYILTFSTSVIQEGNSAIVTLTTTNIDNGTLIPYVISGVTSSDIGNASLTGNFIVNNNASTVTINTLDITGNKTLTISLVNILPVVSAVLSILDAAGEVPGIVNGGSPGSITFTSIANGGNISTLIFDEIFDGGVILTVVNGGLPNTGLFDTVLNGGTPNAVITETYDGGIVA